MPTKQHSNKKKDSQDNLKNKLKQLQLELEEKNDKLLRTQADLQNYQKRMEKELTHKEEEVKKKYISELIDLNELLKKAYEDENPKDGLKLILYNINNLLEREQIKYIDCVGKKFDHVHHHAVTTVEKYDCEDGVIVEEVKKGYLIGEKLLRPSQVVVAKNNNNKNE